SYERSGGGGGDCALSVPRYDEVVVRMQIARPAHLVGAAAATVAAESKPAAAPEAPPAKPFDYYSMRLKPITHTPPPNLGAAPAPSAASHVTGQKFTSDRVVAGPVPELGTTRAPVPRDMSLEGMVLEA